jgi:hypothetical protein
MDKVVYTIVGKVIKKGREYYEVTRKIVYCIDCDFYGQYSCKGMKCRADSREDMQNVIFRLVSKWDIQYNNKQII